MVNVSLNIVNSCSSTNDIAFKAAQKGAKEGVSYLAYEQTKGRPNFIIKEKVNL